MRSEVLLITPELAAHWLDRNTFNRKISRHTVKRYAGDMRSGAWTLNHQGIAFDTDGVLVDGQHRLNAVVEAKCSVEMMVTWGANRVGIDELRPRAAADVIKFGCMSDWVESKHLQISKQMLALFSNAESNSAGVLSTSQILEFTETNKDAVIFADSLFTTHKRGISTAMVRGTIATAYYHFPHEKLADFVGCLYSGVVSNKNQSAVIRAREVLLDATINAGGSSIRFKIAKRIARALVAFCDGKPLARLVEPEKMPFTLPEEKLK